LVERLRLNLIVALIILLISIWLILVVRIWDSMGHLVFGCAIAYLIWTLLRKEEKTSKLLEFFVKSLVISYVITGVVWFVSLGVWTPLYYVYFGLRGVIITLVYIVLPRSLLPVAILVITYGILKTRLEAWATLLSSWYVSIFAVRAAYDVWWSLFVQPYLHGHYYSSGAGALALDMILVLLAFFVACIFTAVYLILKRPKQEPLP